MIYLLFAIVFLTTCSHIECSVGDASPYYQKCVERCSLLNCTADGWHFIEENQQPFYLALLQWSCEDECKHECMWKTVEAFHERDWKTPQFHGKWPFIRLFGIQEPASVLFSILNLYVHLKMIRLFRKEVLPESPFYWLWHLFCLVNINTWIWSTVFHTRDFKLTELMDYICAFSTILISCYCMLIRLLTNKIPKFTLTVLTVVFIWFFIEHVTYLSSGRFDYAYNMQLNVYIGTFTAVCWFTWAFWNRKRQPYVWKCAIFVALTGVVMLLELMDRPPIFYILDYHSLWHFFTAPIVIFFYSFIIDDCNFLRAQKKLEKSKKPV